MRRILKLLTPLALTLALSGGLVAGPAQAMGSGGSDSESAKAVDPNYAAGRQLVNHDAALSHYQAALAIEPRHRGANEYLGELYLTLGDLAKAEERLEVLDDACFFGCEEYTELKNAIAAYKTKAGS